MHTRRALLRAGLYGGSLMILSRCGDGPEELKGDPGQMQQAATFGLPLPIAPVLTPTSTDATTDYYDITARTGTARVRASGSLTPIWGFNGSWPGPTLRATRGRRVVVRMSNALSEPITVHNHGHKVAASSDGHPTDYIQPGTMKTFEYPNDQNAATLWYHAHTMDITAPQVYKGLAGFYLITDSLEQSLNLPSGAYDVPLVIQDRVFNADNTLSYNVDSSSRREGFMGNVFCVNGAETPYFQVARRKYRFRLLNGCNARIVTLELSSGSMVQIASDAALLPAPATRSSIRLAPGERVDVVIDFSNYALGTSVTLRNQDDSWDSGGSWGDGSWGGSSSSGDIMRFDINRNEAETSTVPATLLPITRFTSSQAQVTRTFTLSRDRSSDQWTINGLAYNPARIDFRPRLGTIEKWIINNDSGEDHPFHQHLIPFQVLDIDGSPPGAGLNGWKDTLLIPSRGRATIIMRFEGFTGIYVLHCHILEHEDHRMMLQQEVIA